MPGRKAKPIQLHVLQGTARKDRHNLDAPKPAKALPKPPKWLSKPARGFFALLTRRLEELGLASESHTEMLTLVSIALDEVQRCTAVIDAEGMTCSTIATSGALVIKPRPEVTIRQTALRRAQSILAEFGLSPASVGRVGLKAGEQEHDPWGEL